MSEINHINNFHYVRSCIFNFFWKTQFLFVGPLVPPFQTLAHIRIGFQRHLAPAFFVTCMQWSLQRHFLCNTCWPLYSHHCSRAVCDLHTWTLYKTMGHFWKFSSESNQQMSDYKIADERLLEHQSRINRNNFNLI